MGKKPIHTGGDLPNQTNSVQRAFTDGVRRVLDSGVKIMQRNKNQATSAAVQQDDASTAMQQDATSMTVNTPSVNTPDGSGPKVNAAQECGAMDSDASFLSDFGARVSQIEMNAAHEFSPIGDQVASPVRNDVSSRVNLSTPLRQNLSRDNVAATGMDLLDTPNTTTSSDSVVGPLIPAPSPRRSTQSPATHQLQQTLRNSANEQVLRCDSASSDSSNSGGGAASAFSAFGANKSPTIMETVREDSDDGDGLTGNATNDNVQVNLTSTSEICEFEICDACDSGIALGINQASSHTAGNLVIDAIDPGQEDFVISVGALGNASGTPPDGSQNVSFGEDLVSPEEKRIVDSAAKSAAHASYRSARPGW